MSINGCQQLYIIRGVDMQEMLNILRNIGIWDMVDMAIVAFVFYKLYMLIRETRAQQLIKGIFSSADCNSDE